MLWTYFILFIFGCYVTFLKEFFFRILTTQNYILTINKNKQYHTDNTAIITNIFTNNTLLLCISSFGFTVLHNGDLQVIPTRNFNNIYFVLKQIKDNGRKGINISNKAKTQSEEVILHLSILFSLKFSLINALMSLRMVVQYNIIIWTKNTFYLNHNFNYTVIQWISKSILLDKKTNSCRYHKPSTRWLQDSYV